MYKKFLTLTLLAASVLFAQAQELSKEHDWHNQDLKENKVMGVSANKAYTELLAGKSSKPIIVAIIDSGTEIEHPDLKENIWVNEKEIAGNGIDDDGNGYIDDIHGWSFLGNANGEHITRETSELTRLYKKYSEKYQNVNINALSEADKKEYAQFEKIKEKYEQQKEDNLKQYNNVKEFKDFYESSSAVLKNLFSVDTLTAEVLSGLKTEDPDIKKAIAFQNYLVANNISPKAIDEALDHFSKALKYGINPEFNPRDSIIGDDPTVMDGMVYGSNNVGGQGASHGTHVAGLVGALRNNGFGMNGVASNVKLMIIRAVPDGDERDKDVALAIRYAVDNGAKIINMSFGKSYSPEKHLVDEAVKYADEKGVLLIHAAGNDNNNLDVEENYPSPNYLDGGRAVNWLSVGASYMEKDQTLPASFSNYGQKEVDLFSPGHLVYSTVLKGEYELNSGTSMAAPVCSGVAALVWSYYPDFTATEIKDILMKSVNNQKKLKVLVPGTENTFKKFGELSVSGGVVNAYNALKLAEKMSK